MKRILMALAIIGFTYCTAEAQQALRVCRKGPHNKQSCYNTKYAQNFPVCKDNDGYHICGESKTYKNTSAVPPEAVVKNDNMPQYEVTQGWEGYRAQQEEPMQQDMTPKSQSYPDYQPNATVPYRTGYGEGRGRMRVCYFGDNVAELNKNPYKACPAPAYDGPEKTAERAWTHGD